MLLDISISGSKKKGPAKAPIICVAEEPEGSGCKCGGPSIDGVTARCCKHADWEPQTIWGFKSKSILRGGRHSRKRHGCSEAALQALRS